MNKQEVIRKAYGEYWERLTELQKTFALENNGRTCLGYSSEEKRLFNEIYKSGLFDTQPIRPKSLQGIESNNSWTKIESEADLPTSNGIYWTLRVNSEVPLYKEIFNDMDNQYWLDTYTHFQPITKPLKPIY